MDEVYMTLRFAVFVLSCINAAVQLIDDAIRNRLQIAWYFHEGHEL